MKSSIAVVALPKNFLVIPHVAKPVSAMSAGVEVTTSQVVERKPLPSPTGSSIPPSSLPLPSPPTLAFAILQPHC